MAPFQIPSHGLPENMDITVIGLSKSNFQFSIIERKILIETMNSIRSGVLSLLFTNAVLTVRMVTGTGYTLVHLTE